MADVGGALTGTQLPLMDEFEFRNWLKATGIPFDPNASSQDYDMRGYYKDMRQGNPHARGSEVNANDGKPHFTDYYKMPWHETLSNESQYAGPGAPRWINRDQLADPTGRVVFDEKLMKLLRGDQ